MNISSLGQYRVKKFEKQIRRYLKNLPDYTAVIDNQSYTPGTYHIYFFKQALDVMYKNPEKNIFPIGQAVVYGNMFTNRSLKNDFYQETEENKYLDHIFNNYSMLIIWIYDCNFPHKPEQSFCNVHCVINKDKRLIVPLQFTENLSEIYPRWFEKPLVSKTLQEINEDPNLLNAIQEILK